MSQSLTVHSHAVGTYEPRSPSPLSGRRIPEERGITQPQLLMIEPAPLAPLPVALRTEIVPSPDALWQRLSGQETFPRAEGSPPQVTWEEFLGTMRDFLQHMVNNQFILMNETYARVTEQTSVRLHFYDQAGEYMMQEMMRLVRRVEELEAPERPGDPMDIDIEQVTPIHPTPDYHSKLLDGISRKQWTLAVNKPRGGSRRNPYGKKGSRGNTPDPLGKRGSRSSTPVLRTTAPSGIVATTALPAPVSEAPGSSLDYSGDSSAYSGDSPDPRPDYLSPSTLAQ